MKNLKDEHFDLNSNVIGGSSKLHMILKHEIWQKCLEYHKIKEMIHSPMQNVRPN